MIFATRPLDAELARRAVALFEAAGNGCFCRYWHFGGDKNAWLERSALDPDQNRAEWLDDADAQSPRANGVVALDPAGNVIGWMKLAVPASAPKLLEQRFYARLPCLADHAGGAWIIACVLVHPNHRRTGVSGALLDEAIALATSVGAPALVALPRRTTEPVSAEELWMGPFAELVKRGFREVGGEGPYPVMRLELGLGEVRA
jgi:GNAT superfamily N-acetyltransferase